MTFGQVMNLQEWQQRVSAMRVTDPLLKRGAWHAFLNTDKLAGGPIHGTYALVRWTLPSLVIAHEDPEEAVRLAQLIEKALDDDQHHHQLAVAI